MPSGVLDMSVRANVKELTAKLTRFAEKQVPYATAVALNDLGSQIVAKEKANLKTTFPTATPFTINSVRMRRATKGNPTVTVFVMDAAAKYLTPYEDGGKHVLNSRALLNPKAIPTNQYGNIPRNKIRSLKGRADIFVGSVKTKHGDVSGVWQRTKAAKGAPSKLVLLVRFGEAIPVKERLHYQEIGAATVQAQFATAFNIALLKAQATAR